MYYNFYIYKYYLKIIFNILIYLNYNYIIIFKTFRAELYLGETELVVFKMNSEV